MKTKNTNGLKVSVTYIIMLSLILVSVGITIGVIYKMDQTELQTPVIAEVVSTVTTSEPVSSEPPIPEIQEPVTVNVLGVGDNLIHSGIYDQAKRRSTDGTYDFDEAYKEVADIITNADIASLNQETIMAPIYKPSTYPMFNSPPELAETMIDIGFDVFNQATNHTIDKGEKGLINALDTWDNFPQAKVVGVYENSVDFEEIRTIEKDDITFSFIGMTEYTNGLNLPENSEIILMKTADREKIKQRIEEAKLISDVVVVNVHWGVEYTHSPNQMQRELAEFMIESGADIIFGHHPHVIQPVEYITRSDGTRGIVCYSLGNFISAQNRGPRMIGGMLDVSITKEFENNTISITDVEYIPVVTHYGNGFADIKNYPLDKYTKELANVHGVKEHSPDFSMEFIENTVNSVIDSQFLN